ncbi:hypothetical protein [Lutibacter maritimus]|uniref:DNA-binding protein n=1 Tax=Lutibacter maritimus TaxID=593133 RepID=A0A1I6SJ58_9FLAO|nr:hypothetical protein [Lutibacter maritimus]SFS76788.1 hypothetical protein SAMN04488006_3064 [Lutibacter maritimus]
MKNTIKLLAVLILILTVVSCKDKANYSKINSPLETVNNDLHKIVVKEKIDGGGYVYLNVEEDGKDYWMAIANMPVEVGNTYYYNGGMVMKDFISKHLDKTFEAITFAEGIRLTEEVQVTEDHVHEHSSEMEAAAVMTEKIEKAKGGNSLEEVFKNRATLDKKNVIVKGKVVKVNNGIMDKNWVHIEDGSQFNNEKDLTITTQETVKEGDIVTFKGTIVLNKDFGAGYVYDIILEEATLLK